MIAEHGNTGNSMAEYINRLNKITVLNLIRQEGEISRADIVKKSDLSAPTVTRIVHSLIHNEGLAVQVGIGESRGGRPPVIVRFNGEGNFVIGIDWGRTHIHGIVANLNGETILDMDVKIDAEGEFTNDLNTLQELIKKLIENSGVNKKKILGIGLAVAGFINSNTSQVEYSPNFGWDKVDLKQSIADEFKIPVIVDNVSRVMALGELHYGIGASLENFVFANIGYGIGAGIIIEGKPFNGHDGYSGEIGHTKVGCRVSSENSRTCACGKNDCLECYASGRGIAQTVKENIENITDSLVYKLCNGRASVVTTEKVAQAAKAGDSYARSVFEDAADYLGIAFANLTNILNPEAIVIGGKVAHTGDFFLEHIKKVFEQETLRKVHRPIKIMKSALLGEAAVKGAVALILKEVLDLNVTT